MLRNWAHGINPPTNWTSDDSASLANENNEQSKCILWLYGPAGAGKSAVVLPIHFGALQGFESAPTRRRENKKRKIGMQTTFGRGESNPRLKLHSSPLQCKEARCVLYTTSDCLVGSCVSQGLDLKFEEGSTADMVSGLDRVRGAVGRRDVIRPPGTASSLR
jgi:hypothetical protein